MKMKSMFAGASALGLAIVMASSAMAVEIGDKGNIVLTKDDTNSYRRPGAGEFNDGRTGLSLAGYAASTKDQQGLEGSFQSFCIEKNISSEGANYYSVNTGAVSGGIGGGNPDPISVGTAWLYCQFASGELAGYVYTPGADRAKEAQKLQLAIWGLEDELAPQVGNVYYDMAVAHFGGEDAAREDNKAGGFGVYVLNTWGDEEMTIDKQDQLYYTPVPDGGATVMLLGLALSGFGLARRFIGSKA